MLSTWYQATLLIITQIFKDLKYTNLSLTTSQAYKDFQAELLDGELASKRETVVQHREAVK